MSDINFLQTVCTCGKAIILADGYMNQDRQHICKECWEKLPSDSRIHQEAKLQYFIANTTDLRAQLAASQERCRELEGIISRWEPTGLLNEIARLQGLLELVEQAGPKYQSDTEMAPDSQLKQGVLMAFQVTAAIAARRKK